MKKYKMKIKDDNAKWNTCGMKIRHDIGDGYVWLINRTVGIYSYNLKEGLADVFTEEDINKFPYGFVKQHELIEVEEDLYNIVCPYTGATIKRDREDFSIGWDNTECTLDTALFQRRFTFKEIEDKYPDMLKMIKKCENS